MNKKLWYKIFRENKLNEDKRTNLINYFSTIWVKDVMANNKIRINKYFKDKYGKYLDYTLKDWEQVSTEKLIRVWDEWSKDNKENQYDDS